MQIPGYRVSNVRTAFALCLVLNLQACDSRATSGGTSDPAVNTRIEELVQRSRQRLSYVPAGGFWLGDPGPLMTDALKASGAVLGPEAKPTDNPPFTLSEDNKPPRWVTLDAFSIQQLKVTYGDFDVYTAANGLPQHPPLGDEKSYGRIWVSARTADDVPAGVSWTQARAYCHWLGKVSGLPFDLPTEAQWEFAASNGRKTHWEPAPTDNGLMEEGRNHPTFEWIEGKLGPRGALYPVGQFPPSKLRLHDLIGNGYEWTLDWYAADAYQTMTKTHNPTGPAAGKEKVKRGKPVNESVTFTGFNHTLRYKELPEGLTYKGRLWPYVTEGFRCVVNQLTAVEGSFTAGPPKPTNPLMERLPR